MEAGHVKEVRRPLVYIPSQYSIIATTPRSVEGTYCIDLLGKHDGSLVSLPAQSVTMLTINRTLLALTPLTEHSNLASSDHNLA